VRSVSPAMVVAFFALAGCAAETDASTPAQRSANASTQQSPSPSAKRPAEGDAAVWSIPPDEDLQPSSTTFTALVTRLGCSGGVTGEVLPPEIRMNDSEVIVTFAVAPKQVGPARCPGNDHVAYEVTLPEPLRDRTLVDGQCLPGGDAGTSASCKPDGTRFRP
jgi:hypothetical protein